MATYTNLEAKEAGLHGMFESSKVISTDIGRNWSALVRDESETAIAVDNGVAIKIGEFTGGGLEEVYATIASTKDQIAVTGSPANVKTATTTAQAQAYNFYTKAGTDVKAYEVRGGADLDIFAIAKYQFTDESADAVKVGAYVVVDGKGAWVAQAAKPDDTEYGFIGKVHSIAIGTYYSMVRIVCIKNETVA